VEPLMAQIDADECRPKRHLLLSVDFIQWVKAFFNANRPDLKT
jgi:hypothetical protein